MKSAEAACLDRYLPPPSCSILMSISKALNDSKILLAEERDELAIQIKKRARSFAYGAADAFEIDQVNIYQASRLAMKRAVEALSCQPDYLLVDALKLDLPTEQLALIDGDARCRAIARSSGQHPGAASNELEA